MDLEAVVPLVRSADYFVAQGQLAPAAVGWLTDFIGFGLAIDEPTTLRVVSESDLPGDRIAVEDPCFLGSLNVFNAAGHAPLPVAVDANGMQVESLRQSLEAGARAVLLTPRAHTPTGASLDAKRARALRQVLAAYPQVAVLIDDHYALLSQQAYHSVLPR